MKWLSFVCALLLVQSLVGCKQSAKDVAISGKFQKSTTYELNYETASTLLKDMKLYADAVRKVNSDVIRAVDDAYTDVYFETKHEPLFTKIYPDENGKTVYFLLFPKNSETGSNLVLTFEKPLPVVDSDSIELQFITNDPQRAYTCTLETQDAAAYLQTTGQHEYEARYHLYKRFVQSGTYDFDALSVKSYRIRGYAYISFELLGVTVTDKTANTSFDCR